ncbi:hypothetical protein C7999DRAFT_27937 [Corynascus novoguineensis]|uniref:Uncharacterized protein n=1 Tax=Corynascus novoguineensis TaxID=1126955 RepID=A0AAN7D013_9PEZI|nr:hypothetical protein C7999DRAFT_27937 [Corynascus novoguineensis]
MASRDRIHSDQQSEPGAWTMFGMIDTVRRFADLVSTRTISGMDTSCHQTTMNRRTAHVDDWRQRTEKAEEARGVGEAMTKEKAVGPTLDQTALPDRRTLDMALAQSKAFVSIIASVAAVLGRSATESGIDWRSASQGLDLILNASRDYVARQNILHHHHHHHNASDYDAYFERTAYVNGTQHVLRGLPRDLDPAEAAMLHRSMPQALSNTTAGWPPPGKPRAAAAAAAVGGCSKGGGGRNKVQALALFCMYSMYSLTVWAIPKLVRFGGRLVEAEHERQYMPRLLMALAALLEVVVVTLNWLSGCWAYQLLVTLLGYAVEGVRGAIYEFSSEKVAVVEGVGVTEREDAVKHGRL